MKVKVTIGKITYTNELKTYWQANDYYELLSLFEYADAHLVEEQEVVEMLYMAMSDFEPTEAAVIVLKYKLGNQLTSGQIKAISHEMQEDKIAEEYPDTSLHYDLFNINQLLFKAFNGVFPNTTASVIDVQIVPKDIHDEVTTEVIAKSLASALSEKTIIKRLFSEQLKGKVPFDDLKNFIWSVKNKENGSYEVVTSKYWIEKEDIEQDEFETKIEFYKEDED